MLAECFATFTLLAIVPRNRWSTGNYSVLRDLGSESFRRKDTAADLAKIFAGHRQEHYDVSPILVLEPQFTQQPTEIEPGRLQLIGFFPTQPQAVQFAVVYRRSDAGWGIDEVSVGMAPLNSLVQIGNSAAQTPAQQTSASQQLTLVRYQEPAATR